MHHDGSGLRDPLLAERFVGLQQHPQERGAADHLDEPVGIDVRVHLSSTDRVGQPRPDRDEHVGEAAHDPGVEVGVDRHVGDQPRQRGAHQRAGEHVTGGGDHRVDVGADVARRRLDRGRRRREGSLMHEFGLARPPPVQRRLGGSCALGDRGHREVRIPDFHKQIRGGPQYGSVDTRIPGPTCTRGLVNR